MPPRVSGGRFLYRHFRHRTRSRSHDELPGRERKRLGGSHVHYRRAGHDSALLDARGERAGVPCWRCGGHPPHPRGVRRPRGRRPVPGDRGGGKDRADEAGERRRAGDRRPASRRTRRRDTDDARYAVARQHASRRAVARTEADRRGVPHARRHGPPGLRNGRCRCLGAPGDAHKRHRTPARARNVRNRPARRPGSTRLRQLPSSQPDSLRTARPRRS